MDQDEALAAMMAYVREHFGQMVQLQKPSVVRKAAGRTWRSLVQCPTPWGNQKVGHLAIHEEGRWVETCTAADLMEAIVRAHTLKMTPGSLAAQGDPWLDGLDSPSQGLRNPGDVQLPSALETMPPLGCSKAELRKRIHALKASGTPKDLQAARELLPMLFADDEGRRYALVQLGEVELRLGHRQLALEYLEVAAKEFADRSQLRALEVVASMAHGALGEQEYTKSTIKHLIDLSRRRCRPIELLSQAPAFAGLPASDLEEIASLGSVATVPQGECLLKEGAEAVSVFVIKSGVLSVRLQRSDGTSRLARCCFPGALVGETSVVGKPGAVCSATVRPECLTTLWAFDGARLRALCDAKPPLRARFEGAQALHQLDSFFSMHETTQTLDAGMRDKMLACVVGFRRAEADELLNIPGEIPSVVYLVAEGAVAYAAEGVATRVFRPDAFLGLRDALHGIATEGNFVSDGPCLLVAFDANRLRALVNDSPPDVTAILERLG